jgi:integrase
VSVTAPNPTAKPYLRERSSGVFWYAKWSRNGRPVVRSLGRAWAEPDGRGGWRRRRGRAPEDCLTEAQAHERMLALVREHHADLELLERDEFERRRRGVTFREVALDYLDWLGDVRGAKPSTLRAVRSDLSEPGVAYKRGGGVTAGRIMKALGDRPAVEISTREVNQLLREFAATGVSPRTVNKMRQLVCAIFNYGMKPGTWGLKENPVTWADRRREPTPAPLPYFSVEQVEALARAFESGAHRDPAAQEVGAAELAERAAEDRQDAELVRVAAYSGLRRGELVTLRWRDISFVGRKIIVSRTLSADVEATSTKSGRVREVPLPDQAAGALDRLSRRANYTGPDEYVFCNRFGRRLDASALRRRYERARNAAKLPPLRFHDLRHTYGSLLVEGGVDLISVKAAMGHSQISTTERYLHARPATELANRFTTAFGGSDAGAASRAVAGLNTD